MFSKREREIETEGGSRKKMEKERCETVNTVFFLPFLVLIFLDFFPRN